MKQKLHRVIFVVSTLLLLTLLYKNSLFSYFSQDDFFHLRIIMDKNLGDIPSFFISWSDGQTFYRPLSREVFNLLMYKIFGFNALPFHLVNFLFILVNAYVIYLLLKKITKNINTGIFTAILYLFSAAHSVHLYYLASVQQLFVTILSILSIWYYLNFIQKRKVKDGLYSLFLYILALLSHGMAIILPGVLVIFELNKYFKKAQRLPKGSFIIGVLFVLATFFYVIGSSLLDLPGQDVYRPIFSLKTVINTLFWYILWSAGLPEMLVDFVGPKFVINSTLIKFYGRYFIFILPLLIINASILILLFIKFKGKILKNYFAITFISAFLISLLPFLFFPQHKFVYYLDFSLVWFSSAIGLFLGYAWNKKKYWKLLSLLFLVCYITISFQTTQINEITYWAAKRSKAAQVLLRDINIQYPMVDKGAIFYIQDDINYPFIAVEWGKSSRQAFYILSGSDALKLLYKDLSLKAYFEDKGGIPEGVKIKEVLPYIAKFPY